MAYDMTGTVKLIEEAQVFASGFSKKCIVLTVEDGKYPQDVVFEFVQDSVAKLDAVNEGDIASITFDIRGREYNGRYFNNLVGWKISVEGKATSDAPQLPPDFAADVAKGVADAKDDGEFDEKIPF